MKQVAVEKVIYHANDILRELLDDERFGTERADMQEQGGNAVVTKINRNGHETLISTAATGAQDFVFQERREARPIRRSGEINARKLRGAQSRRRFFANNRKMLLRKSKME